MMSNHPHNDYSYALGSLWDVDFKQSRGCRVGCALSGCKGKEELETPEMVVRRDERLHAE
jgi:hypothetical protein